MFAKAVPFLLPWTLAAALALQEGSELEELEALLETQPEELISRLEARVQKDPSPQAHFLLARAWAGLDAQRSLLWLEKVFEQVPGHRLAWQLWADIVTAAGQYEFAVLRLEQQLRRHPELAHLRLLLAQLHVNAGAFGRAEEEFRRAAEEKGADSEIRAQALYSRGFLCVRLGRVGEGEDLLRRVLEVDPLHVPTLAALAGLLWSWGNGRKPACSWGVLRSYSRKIPKSCCCRVGTRSGRASRDKPSRRSANF